MRVAVLTISDSVTKGEREDLSGPAVVAFCRGLAGKSPRRCACRTIPQISASSCANWRIPGAWMFS